MSNLRKIKKMIIKGKMMDSKMTTRFLKSNPLSKIILFSDVTKKKSKNV